MNRPDAPPAHPSFLELDRHALGAPRGEVAAHVAACAICRARLAEAAPPGEIPAWARALGARHRARFAWPALHRLRPIGFGIAALACIAVVWTAGRTRLSGYVGSKGGPAAEIFVKHGDRVELWNGSDPISPGDLLRVNVQPDRFAHVSVFALRSPPATFDRVYDATVSPERAVALPFSLRTDERGRSETLVVVLGRDSLEAAALNELLASGGDSQHWLRRFLLRKTSGGDGAAP